MGEERYHTASVKGSFEVNMFRDPEEDGSRPFAERKITMEFSDRFANPNELEASLEAFKKSVIEAASRP